MTHKYKLGDYVEHYSSYYKNGDKTEYVDLRRGFVTCIEDRMLEDGSVVVRYSVGPYNGACGYVVCEEAIVKKLKAPKNQSKIEYLKAKVRQNETQIETLNHERESLRREIEKLEEEQAK